MGTNNITELPKAQVTIMKAVEEAVLAIEALDTTEVLISQSARLHAAKDNLVRALADLQKLRKGLGEVEDSIVAMGCEISGH